MAAAVGLGTALFFLAFLSPVVYSVDGNSMVAVAVSIVTRGSFAVPQSLGIPGVGGLYYSVWYPLLSFLAVPLVEVGVLTAHLLHLPVHFTAAAFALILTPILVGATSGLVVMLALRLGAVPRGSILGAVGFAFGTIVLVHAREFYAEPLLALITVAALYLELGNRRGRLAVGPLAALAVLAKPPGAILGPLLAVHGALKERSPKPLFVPLIGTAVGIALYFLYNHVRFGDAFRFGHPATLSLTMFPVGAAGMLVSPACGLVWYCPPVLALFGLRARVFSRLDVLLVVSTALAYLTLYAAHGHGGMSWCWGPRYLVPALPGLMALCGLLEGPSRKALIVLTVLGFLINAPNLVSYYERIYQEDLSAGRPERPLWSLREAAFVRIWGSMSREVSDAWHTDVRALVQQAGKPEDSPTSWRTLRLINVWWWILPAVGIPRAYGAAVSLLLAIGGLGLLGWALACAGEDTTLTPEIAGRGASPRTSHPAG